MGFYIETGNIRFGKADIMINKHGAGRIPVPRSFDEVPENMALICVVHNGMFEAVGYCYDEREFKLFSDPDDFRPKSWLIMDKKLAEKLSNYRK